MVSGTSLWAYGVDDEWCLAMGRPLVFKPSTCPHATEMGALREVAHDNIEF